MEKNLINYIKKSHIEAVQKFNEEQQAWAKETGEDQPTLYEDANTSFTLSDIAISNDGQVEFEVIVRYDDIDKCYYEDEGSEGIMEYIKFWRACLRRAKRYWAMDSDKLDKIQDGEIEDDEEED